MWCIIRKSSEYPFILWTFLLPLLNLIPARREALLELFFLNHSFHNFRLDFYGAFLWIFIIWNLKKRKLYSRGHDSCLPPPFSPHKKLFLNFSWCSSCDMLFENYIYDPLIHISPAMSLPIVCHSGGHFSKFCQLPHVTYDWKGLLCACLTSSLFCSWMDHSFVSCASCISSLICSPGRHFSKFSWFSLMWHIGENWKIWLVASGW